jgi:phosphopantetheine--protein transferase-like protein
MSRRPRPLDVAIVGMACRFPGAGDLFAYWENTLAARDSIREVPPSRWDPAVFFDPDSTEPGRVAGRRGGYLDEPIPFDPASFGIMPRTVEGGEPEQFLVLDAARSALADAGVLGGLDGRRVEVVIGRGNYFNRGNLTRLQHGRVLEQTLSILHALHPDWLESDLDAIRADLRSNLPPFESATIPGQLTNATAGRLADRFNLAGASFVVDAASASGLVAVDLGARALVERRADLAIVGSVYIEADVDFPMVFSRLGGLSRSGRARPFAEDADGMVPGEGVGVVVLKRLKDAERDGDRVYAVLKGLGLASDGRGPGLAAPDARGHLRAIRRAYRRSGVEPATVGLIEGHGLGVPAADRAELRALRAAFPPTSTGSRRVLGAASGLIGHAMPAAGIAGLIKAALSLHHRVLPASIGADRPHRLLARVDRPLALNPTTRPWIQGVSTPRRAGVNAFGFAGISAHAVLEEHPASADGVTAGAMLRWPSEAILIEAGDREGLVRRVRRLVEQIERRPDVGLKDLAYTLAIEARECVGSYRERPSTLPSPSRGEGLIHPLAGVRLGLVVGSTSELITRLESILPRIADPSCRSIRDGRGVYFWEKPLAIEGGVACLFPGEGSQYAGMLADLCPHFPEVRKLFDTSDRLARESGVDRLPSETLFGAATGDPALWQSGIAVNVVLSSQWALYQLLLNLGLRPSAVAGHSSGEFLALAAAGVVRVDRGLEDRFAELAALFTRVDAAGGVAARLVGVAAGRERVEAAIGGRAGVVSVAVDNCPHQVVIAGPTDEVEPVAARLREQGVMTDDLPFSRAYHTPAFAPMLGPIRDFFDSLDVSPPALPLYSCCSAARMPGDVDEVKRLAVAQWTRPVEFRRTIDAMHAAGLRMFVDVGARGNLAGFVEDTLRGEAAFTVAANLPRRSGLTQLNHLVASLYAHGVDLTPEYLFARRRPERIDLDAPAPSKSTSVLEVGFPEMRLSAGVIERFRAICDEDSRRVRCADALPPSSNGKAPAVSSEDRPHSGPYEDEQTHDFAARLEQASFEVRPSGGIDEPPDDPAMLAYLDAMDGFLSAQRAVMDGYLGAGVEGDHLGFDVLDSTHATPHPNPPPQGGRGTEESPRHWGGDKQSYIAEVQSVPLPPCGGGLGWGVDRGEDARIQVSAVAILPDPQPRFTTADLRPRPPMADPGPWAGVVTRIVEGREVEAVITLDAEGDPVAEHHTFGGRRISALDPSRKGLPVLPFTVMAEMLAQVSARLMPGATLVGFRDLRARRWVRYEDEPIALEVIARADPDQPGEVVAALYNRVKPGDAPDVEGIVRFAHERTSPPQSARLRVEQPEASRFTARSIYDDQWLFHGPALQSVVEIGAISDLGIEGTLRVLPRGGLYRDPTVPRPLTDPIVLDAYTHLLGAWGLDRLPEGDVIFPLRLARLDIFGDDPPEGADCPCQIRVKAMDRHRVAVDAEILRPDGRVWMRLDDWEDWRFYWPSRYRDVFRQPDRTLLGEPLLLADGHDAVAVWLEPPADMGRPVWRDVLEQVQLSPEERAGCLKPTGHEGRRTLRLWGRIAAKDAARRLWLEDGKPPTFPADLSIEPDPDGRPVLRLRADPGGVGMPAVSIAHKEGVAVAIAARSPVARVGIDVERIVERADSFEAVAFSAVERDWLDRVGPDDRVEWIARLWCAKEAVAKATGHASIAGPSSVEVVAMDVSNGRMEVTLGPEFASACRELSGAPVVVHTRRRGDYAWAWTLTDAEVLDR